MFISTATIIFPEAIAKDMVDGYVTLPVAAPFNLTSVRLFTNVFNPSVDMVIGDFTEATFAGYAVVAGLVWLGPVNLAAAIYGMHVEANFLAIDPIVAAENVEGYYLTDAAGTELRAAERFPTPVPFAQGGDFLALDLILPIPAFALAS